MSAKRDVSSLLYPDASSLPLVMAREGHMYRWYEPSCLPSIPDEPHAGAADPETVSEHLCGGERRQTD